MGCRNTLEESWGEGEALQEQGLWECVEAEDSWKKELEGPQELGKVWRWEELVFELELEVGMGVASLLWEEVVVDMAS